MGFDASLFMPLFYINSFLTNILLTETLNLCIPYLYRNQAHVGNLTKSLVYNLLKTTMFESFSIFDEKLYEQCNGTASIHLVEFSQALKVLYETYTKVG